MKEFENILGYESVKVELYKICDTMININKYAKLGVKTPRGLLLYGEPGVGKTLMANCIIEACHRKTYTVRKDKTNGDFVKDIKKTFQEAAKNAPAIIFLDDIDKFANEDEKHCDAQEYVAIQACIDQYKNKELFVLATANNVDKLPGSLTRTGRFDKVIEIQNPSGDDAKAVIGYYLSKKKFVKNVNVDDIAPVLNGYSCSDLETVINEAGIYAGYAGKNTIELEDIIKAVMRVVFEAPESLDEPQKKHVLATAYHEAGHAVIAEILEPGSISLISIKSHNGNIGGITSYNQKKDYFYEKKYMDNRILSLLGGKAATEIVYGTVDVGAASDLVRVFLVVKRFTNDYCAYGYNMTNFGCNYRESIDIQSDIRRSEKISEMIESYYQTAKNILLENKKFLDALANALVEKETLITKDIQEIKSRFKAKGGEC